MVPIWQIVACAALAFSSTNGTAPTPRQEPSNPASGRTALAEDPFVEGTLGQVRAWAGIQDKQVLVAFYAVDCAACDALDATTFTDERVRAWLSERVLVVRMRPESDYMNARWRILERPTLLFLTPRGEELGRLTGYHTPESLLAAAGGILTGQSGLERARALVEQAPRDPWARLLLARALTFDRRRDETLPDLLAVFDATRGDPTWRRQREEEVLQSLGILARVLPEAKAALIERRDAQLAVLLAAPGEEGPGEDDLLLAARDLRLMNNLLGGAQQTLSTWEALRRREDVSAAVCEELFGWEVAALLIRARRYEELLAALPDPVVLVDSRMAEVLRLEDAAEEDPEAGLDPQLEHGRMVVEAGVLYEALLGVGRDKDAGDVVELLLAFEPAARAYTSLVLGAKRAGRLDLARAHVERGLETLQAPAERERLRRFSEAALDRER